MKRNFFSKVFQASLLCCLAVFFVGCEELGMESNPTPSYISLNTSDVTLKVGGTFVRKAIVAGTAVVIYSSSNEAVATVDQTGKITAVGEGTATITALVTGYDAAGKKIYTPEEKSYKVTVTPATVAVTGLTLDAAILRLDNTVKALTATVAPADATDKTVTWVSSDPSVATVDASGNVTPIAKGTATITATAADQTATSTVFVYDKIHNINIDGEAAVPAGKSWLIEGNGTAVANAIYIGNGATVTLNGINITQHIECSATATIILADGSINTITAPADKAGITVGATQLTINAETAGTGKLTTTGGYSGAGIGTDKANSGDKSCGNIIINGGTIDAIGGWGAAGIGTGYAQQRSNLCGNITINGGKITTTGGQEATGIGTGRAYGNSTTSGSQTCGNITISAGVTSVTATKGTYGTNSIGKGINAVVSTQTCGTITIGGVVKAQTDFTGATYTYEP